MTPYDGIPDYGEDFEKWIFVSGFPGYEISNFGRIRSRRKILSASDNGRGYLSVRLWRHGKKFSLKIHRAVADAFLANKCGHNEINHIDGNKKNNHASNLEWSNRSENMRHAHRSGLNVLPVFRGESHYKSTLTADQVREIRSLAAAGVRRAVIAEKFCINPRTVSGITNGRRWAHVH